MKKLLWRCDDFGSATGANEAFLRLARAGFSFNISVLICGPEAATGLKELAKFSPQICLGIHAAVTSEWTGLKWGPVARQTLETDLVDANGHFYPDYEGAQKVAPELIGAEIEAQIRRGREWGIPFSYLDEHMGFGWIPGVSAVLADLASTYGLIYRPDLRRLSDDPAKGADLVSRMAHRLSEIQDEEPRLAFFHPAVDDESTRKFYDKKNAPGVISRDRQEELEALTGETWRSAISQSDVRLLTYPDL